MKSQENESLIKDMLAEYDENDIISYFPLFSYYFPYLNNKSGGHKEWQVLRSRIGRRGATSISNAWSKCKSSVDLETFLKLNTIILRNIL